MDISAWLNDTITVRHRTGVGATGNPTYATLTNVAARVMRKTRAVVGIDGETVNSSHHVTVMQKIDEEDQLILPSESSYRRPVRVDEGRDKFGNVTHYEVWL